MKKKRQQTILDLIEMYPIETQEELAQRLKDAGFDVTQATISRDIRQMNITKSLNDEGKQCYIQIKKSDDKKGAIKSFTLSVDSAGNIIVIKTKTGMGMAVAVQIDDFSDRNIIGTIAGDDVVFCAIKDAQLGIETTERLKRVLM